MLKVEVANQRCARQLPARVKLRRADMKLEPDLLRALLIHVEGHAQRPHSNLECIEIDGWSQDEITHHVVMAHEDGLIKASIFELPGDGDLIEYEYDIHGIHMRGYEFINLTRDEAVWRKTKDAAKKAGLATGDQLVRTVVTMGAEATGAFLKQMLKP